MPMAWPQFEVSPRFAFCMIYLFIVSFFKWDACFCQQPAWALLDFSAFPFCPFCLLYLLLILFGGCRSTRRSSAKSPPARRRTSGAPWPTATSRWSTRGASVTIYLYVTKTTTADRRLSEPDLHKNCFGFFLYVFFSLQIRHLMCPITTGLLTLFMCRNTMWSRQRPRWTEDPSRPPLSTIQDTPHNPRGETELAMKIFAEQEKKREW